MSSGRALIASIAGISALGFAVLSLIYWAFVANPPLSFSSIDWTLRILVILAIVCFSIYLFATPATIGQAVSRRSNRLAANAVVAAVIALAIVLVINIIAESVPTVRADWTASKTFTLSPQTLKVLGDLDKNGENVDAISFWSQSQPGSVDQTTITDLLKEYASHTSHFKWEIVDPINSPARALAEGVNSLSATGVTVVFDNGKKQEKATNVTESDFTGALVRLNQTGTKTVAFLTGHGERDPNGSDQKGYSQVTDSLTKDNYRVVAWSLVTSPTLTLQDATVLVIAEPQKPLSQKEVQTIEGYLNSGGHAMILYDTLMPTDAFDSLAPIAKKYGVTPVQGGVVDLQKSYSQQEPTTIIVNTYPTGSQITADMSRDQLITLFPLSLGLRPPTSTVGGLTATSIVQSSEGANASWLETDIKPNTGNQQIQLKYDASKDLAGPVSMGVTLGPDTSGSTTVTNTTNTRLVLFGDADFPSNLVLSQQLPLANLDLFSNSISWLAGNYELVSIRPKDPATPRKLALSTQQQNVLFTSTVIGLPLLVIIAGGFVWWRRR